MLAHFSAWREALVSQDIELDEQYFYRHSGTPSSRVIPMFAAEQGKEIDFQQALADKEKHFLESIDLLKRIPHVVEIAESHRGKLKWQLPAEELKSGPSSTAANRSHGLV